MKALYTIMGIIVGIVIGTFIPRPVPTPSPEKNLIGKKGDMFDRAFLQNMIVHNEQAVQMSQNALASASHVELKNLAQDMYYAQESQIDKMKQWQREWYK